MSREKIPDRVAIPLRVNRERLAAFDAAVKAARKSRPQDSLTRNDALAEAMALWVAAESAKGGA